MLIIRGTIRRMQKCLLLPLLALLAFGQSNDVLFGGVQLRLGLSTDAVLAKFVSSTFHVQKDDDSYMVAIKSGDVWDIVGYLTFKAGKLSRITVENYDSESDAKGAVALARAEYTAIAAGEKAGIVDVWTERNDDANSPEYKVHLVFKDREVQITSFAGTFRIPDGVKKKYMEKAFIRTTYPAGTLSSGSDK
jgi:hypothetical protein